MIAISARLLNGFLSFAASEVMWPEQSFCNIPVYQELRFSVKRARALSEKIHELRTDYQTIGVEGHRVKAPGYCSENVLLANPLKNTCTYTRENTSNDLNPIFINWCTVYDDECLR